jgi:hypothetical protein
MAAEILYERGLRLNAVRDEIARQSAPTRAARKRKTRRTWSSFRAI